ncbi:MAG: hypothetical protein ACYDHB_08795, partial [Candidatus Dormibacteria bacterium]
PRGVPLEVVAVELDSRAFLVIHPMRSRCPYQAAYQEEVRHGGVRDGQAGAGGERGGAGPAG